MQQKHNVQERVSAGALGGLAGGVAFGFIMHWQGVLPVVAKLVGADTVLVGYIVHMVISAIIGAIFGLLYGPAQTVATALKTGTLYGVIWWFLGPQIILPIWLGMPLPDSFAAWVHNAFFTWLIWSLVGHILYGIISALLGQILQGVVGGLFLGLRERARA
ncbi:hypothetical protein [Deinococcus roseus]|uniref:DUF1440 domain-containing protein n=1 Tax=Deinococcus roseus TaxID=392414 RepID=A0ABQ2CVA2_9DEIO|nr:hypothetical protein [Deinococcus roseus]GGJ23947.1 hypothetical protein GCM10008938_07650 [Deinococcus roseus]